MIRNPFEVTKAVDFSDSEIERRYVRYSDSVYSIVDPRSQATQYLVGGKGGGRTHLMRYFSYPLQKKRAEEEKGDLVTYLQDSSYLGVYAPSSSLDGNRFAGSGIEDTAWQATFAYSTELWLAILLVDVLADIRELDNNWAEAETGFVADAQQLLGENAGGSPITTFSSLLDVLRSMKQAVDRSVNNAPLTRDLPVTIEFNPGSVIFGLGRLFESLPQMGNVRITYMLDELENLTEKQQRFINTLIREKQLPTSFLIGSRIYGIRTFETYTPGEENKKGSEYDWIVPEDAYALNPGHYRTFCDEMVQARLREAGVSPESAQSWVGRLNSLNRERLRTRELQDTLKDVAPSERQHIRRLHDRLKKATQDPDLADFAVKTLSFPDEPLVEKLGILRFFQAWSSGNRPSKALINDARDFVAPLLEASSLSPELENFLGLWRGDMVAQIYVSHRKEQPYSGFDDYVKMSGYLPRNLLVALKNTVIRASWKGEDPLSGSGSISSAAQGSAIRDAAEWYFEDVLPLGEAGVNCNHAIRRLGTLLRHVRFSDKPSEVSVTSFSSSLERISDETRRVVDDCVSHRLLLEVGEGREARNRGELHRKFQLHPMLSPLFSLGFGRRGDLTLTPEEVSAIFDPGIEEKDYRRFVKRKVEPLNAPFSTSEMETLFELT